MAHMWRIYAPSCVTWRSGSSGLARNPAPMRQQQPPIVGTRLIDGGSRPNEAAEA
jgi:hypothetical protein